MKSNIKNLLEDNNIGYAIIKGDYDKESYKYENTNIKEDLDIVLDCNKNLLFDLLNNNNQYKFIEGNTFLEVKNNLRIDFYFKTINVGYYHFLKVSKISFQEKKITSDDYIIYLLLEPLLKFNKYHSRHIYRIKMYFKNFKKTEVLYILQKILGKKLSLSLVNKVSNNNFNISKGFIKICKIKLLFINNNFVKMIKSRTVNDL